MSLDALFTPYTLNTLTIPNRIVMAPMTRSFSPGGVPGANVAEYYERRARGGVGLIITEGTVVDRPGASNDPNVPHFYGEAALAGWQAVVERVHAAGGLIAPQLWHVGAFPNRQMPDYKVGQESPSGVYAPGRSNGAVMTDADVEGAIQAFADSAAHAKRLGFDAVELHGAHGYLIDAFQWSGTNTRDDRWGGSDTPSRARFAVGVVRAVRAAVGPDFPLILRLSQWKQQDFAARLANTPGEMAAWLQPLADAGVDAFHCSQRRFWEPEFPEIDGEDGLNFAGWAKKLTGRTAITVGSIGLSGEFVAAFQGEGSQPASIDALTERLAAREFDLAAVGRALIVDPEWAHKVREQRHDDLLPFERTALGELV